MILSHLQLWRKREGFSVSKDYVQDLAATTLRRQATSNQKNPWG